MRGKRPGEPVRLRMEWWEGLWPEPGDFLVTDAGSAYLVDEIRPARKGSTTTVFTACCTKVTTADALRGHDFDGARIFGMSWAKRRKRNRFPGRPEKRADKIGTKVT